jgi:hypothetical protein
VAGLVDTRLGEEAYDVDEAGEVVRIAVECAAVQPGLRSAMAQVRVVISEKVARSIPPRLIMICVRATPTVSV